MGNSNYPLGRIVSPKDDRDFKMAAVLPTPKIASKFWTPGPILNQGLTPECVGCGFEGLMNGSPVRQFPPKCLSWDGIYDAAQLIDGEPLPHDGTTVRAGVTVLKKAGNVASYHWSTTFNDIWNWILTMGPVVVGTNWYESMFDPAASGLIKIAGEVAGGHCYILNGASISMVRGKRTCRARNSWGPDWGVNGNFWIPEDIMTRLLSEEGEAVACIEHAI